MPRKSPLLCMTNLYRTETHYRKLSDAAAPTGDPGLVLWTTMLAISGCGGLITMKKLGKKDEEE